MIPTSDPSLVVCPSCGRPCSAEWSFCGTCGTRLNLTECPNCGRTIPGLAYCVHCGTHLGESSGKIFARSARARDGTSGRAAAAISRLIGTSIHAFQSLGAFSRLTLATACFIAGLLLTPPPGWTEREILGGWIRLPLYLLSALFLASAPSADPAKAESSAKLERYDTQARADVADVPPPDGLEKPPSSLLPLLVIGLLIAGALCIINVGRLQTSIADPLGPPLWILSMSLVAMVMATPAARLAAWPARWGSTPSATSGEPRPDYRRYLPWVLLVLVLVVAAAVRFIALGSIPVGIHPDEGDRSITAMSILDGSDQRSWFDSGWYYINMVYFRVLSVGIEVFGPTVAGARTLSAIVGLAFVGVISWIGVRNFGWRVGLLAASFAATGALTVQHSRFVSEAGITALLWALSIGGFLEGARSGRFWAFALAGLTGGLSLYFYPSARLWAVGASLTTVVFWIHAPKADRPKLVSRTLVAAAAACIAVAPFLVHLEQHRDEATLRYDETSALLPKNQVRLSYLRPGMPTSEVLILQFERSLGMFDRYPDGGGFLPMGRPVYPQPLGGLAILAIFYVLARAWRDPRHAVLCIWFWIGFSGVILTVETPNYIRATGALPALPLILALLVTDLAAYLPGSIPRLISALELSHPTGPGLALDERRIRYLTGAGLAVFAVAVMTTDTYYYFARYGTMAKPWAPITGEGMQVAELGKVGPVYSMESSEHMVNSGWVRFLAQQAERGRLANPGQQLPILATGTPVPPAAPAGQSDALPVPGPGQGLSFLLYPDPNQATYAQLLQTIYPLGRWLAPDDGRNTYQISADQIERTRGVMVRLASSTGSGTRVQTFGEIPSGTVLPANVEWRAGIRLPESGHYRFRLETSRPAKLSIDDVEVLTADRGGVWSVEIDAARGLHLVRLSATVDATTDRLSLSRLGPLGEKSPTSQFQPITPDQTYALMDTPWGLLGHVTSGGNAKASAGSDLSASFLDTTVAAAFLHQYVPLTSTPYRIEWDGWLLAPRAGTYRMAFSSDGVVGLQIDNHPVDVASVKPDSWKSVGSGTTVDLQAGPHPVRITLTMTNGGRSVVRWNWVPPLPDGRVDPNTSFTVVPPTVLRPLTPVRVIETSRNP